MNDLPDAQRLVQDAFLSEVLTLDPVHNITFDLYVAGMPSRAVVHPVAKVSITVRHLTPEEGTKKIRFDHQKTENQKKNEKKQKISFLIDRVVDSVRNMLSFKTFAVIDDDEFNTDLLVGIEPNPGPAPAPSHAKRDTSHKRNVSKKEQSKQNKWAAKQDRELKKLRELSARETFHPEGYLDFDLGDGSKAFLSGLMSEFREILTEHKIVHSHSLEPPQFVADILSWVHSLFGNAKTIVVGFVKLLLTFVPHAVRTIFFSLATIFCPELGVDTDTFVPEMDFPAATFFSALYASNFSDAIERGSWEKFVSALSGVKKSMGVHANAFSVLRDIVRELVAFLGDTFGLRLPNFTEPSELTAIVTSLAKVQDEYRTGVLNDYAFADRVFALQSDMEALLHSPRKVLDSSVKERLTYHLRKFQPIVQWCEKNCTSGNGPRTEPLGILIAGPTGTGKSTVTVPFLLALLSRILPSDKMAEFAANHNDFLFFRATENEFWDGYRPSNVAVVYDDFGQQKDLAGSPCPDAFEIIRLVNAAPYHLHFASIEDKARNFARPKLIFATSNRPKLHFESIVSNEAVVRRFDLAYVMTPKIEFCRGSLDTAPFSRELDMEKVRAYRPLDINDPSTYVVFEAVEFIQWDFLRGKQVEASKTLSFAELLDLATTTYHAAQMRGDAMLAHHEYMKTKYKPEMAQPADVPNADASPEQTFHTAFEVMPEPAIPPSSNSRDELCAMLRSWATVVIGELNRRYEPSKWMRYCTDQFAWVARSVSLRQALEAMASVGAVVFACYKSLTFLSSLHTMFFGAPPTGESNTARKPGAKKGRVRNKNMLSRARARDMKLGRFKVEGSVPDLEASMAVLKRNTYLVSVRGHTIGSCLFFGRSHFLWPRHFTDHIMSLTDSDDEASDAGDDWQELVKFSDPLSTRTAFILDFNEDIDYYNLDRGHDMSLCFVRGNKVRPHKNIVKMFLSAAEAGALDAYYDAQIMMQRSRTIVGYSMRLSIGDDVEYSNENNKYMSRGLLYSAPTQLGDCGAFLLVNDARLGSPRIFGIHTAGNQAGSFRAKSCLGVAVFSEELNNFIGLSDNDEDVELPFDEVEELVGVVPEGASISGFKTVAVRKQPREPVATKLRLTALAPSLWPRTTKPAHLRPFLRDGVLVDPKAKAREAYSHDEVFIDGPCLSLAGHFVSNLILKRIASEPHSPRLLTFEEAVVGIPGLPYCDAVNRSTSPGYPFVLDNAGCKGKAKWLGSDDTVDFNTAGAVQLRAKVANITGLALLSTRGDHIFVDVLKDERRPILKVDEGKTRQIMTCPMDLLVAMKMYFGDFVRHVLDNRILNGCAVGIDPFSEWSQLAAYLQPTSDHVFTAGDYSRYDGRIPVPIGMEVLRIIECFYAGCPQEDTRVRFVLFQEIINSRHLADGLVYEFYGGNPSGQPLTSVFNSVANLLILSYTAYRSVGQDVDLVTQSLKRTRFQVFGDDNIISYHPMDAQFWAQDVLEIAIPECVGMEYTNENKDGVAVSARPITSISFLKRGFRYDAGQWMCPLELGVLKETLSWERQNATHDERVQRVEATLSELARHGRRVFRECAPTIIAASQAHLQYSPQNLTYTVALSCTSSLAL